MQFTTPSLATRSSSPLTSSMYVAIAVALGLSGGCNPPQNNADTAGQGSPSLIQPGIIVQCGSSGTDPRLVCISHEDYKCTYSGEPKLDDVHYVRKAICAEAWGGTPVDYVGPPHQIEDGTAQDPMIVSGDGHVECANWMESGAHAGNITPPDDPETGIDESTAIVKNRYFPPNLVHVCDACRVCDLQTYGWKMQGYPDKGWDDYPWCPGKGDEMIDQAAVDTFWANDCVAFADPTGGEATSGDGATSGDSPDNGIFVCNGAQTICGTMFDKSETPTKESSICMWGGLIPPCVVATSATAQDECHDYCLLVDGSYIDQAGPDLDPFDYKTWSGLPCAEVYQFEAVKAQDPTKECAGGGPMPSLNSVLPFRAEGQVSTESGNSTRETVLGVLEVEPGDPCPEGAIACEFTISRMVSHTSTIHGDYRISPASEASTLPFVLAGLDVQLAQPVHGIFSPRDGTLRFPDAPLYFSVSFEELLVGNVVMSEGGDIGLFKVNDVTGTWDGKDLSLEIDTTKAGVVVQIQITAR